MNARSPNRPPFHLARFLALAVLAAVAVGCGGRGGGIPEGCTTGDAVPAAVRAAVGEAAARFYEHARRGEGQAIYEEASAEVRARNTPRQFLDPIMRISRQAGFPPLDEGELTVIRFGGGSPYAAEFECAAGDTAYPDVYMLTPHPLQASLVQRGRTGGETLYYSTLWFHEDDGKWRLAAIFVRPATVHGRDAAAWAEAADEELLAERGRNAALLYNVAIDLALPAAWVKPGRASEYQRRQRRISVSQLPADRVDPWIAAPDTFYVFSAQYSVNPEGLGLHLRFEAPPFLVDDASRTSYAERLFRYVKATFPEYPRVFNRVTVDARLGPQQQHAWQRSFPLTAER